MPSSRGASQPRDRTPDSHIAGRVFTSCAAREAQDYQRVKPNPPPGGLPNPGIELGFPHRRWILCQLS